MPGSVGAREITRSTSCTMATSITSAGEASICQRSLRPAAKVELVAMCSTVDRNLSGSRMASRALRCSASYLVRARWMVRSLISGSASPKRSRRYRGHRAGGVPARFPGDRRKTRLARLDGRRFCQGRGLAHQGDLENEHLILVAAFLQERDQFGEGVGRTKNAFADHKEFVLGHHAALRLREASVAGVGRGMSRGHSRSAGQLVENQRTTRSARRSVQLAPDLRPMSHFPSFSA